MDVHGDQLEVQEVGKKVFLLSHGCLCVTLRNPSARQARHHQGGVCCSRTQEPGRHSFIKVEFAAVAQARMHVKFFCAEICGTGMGRLIGQ
eukprot:1146327-Pelagomonas_calceolata.AAC.2